MRVFGRQSAISGTTGMGGGGAPFGWWGLSWGWRWRGLQSGVPPGLPPHRLTRYCAFILPPGSPLRFEACEQRIIHSPCRRGGWGDQDGGGRGGEGATICASARSELAKHQCWVNERRKTSNRGANRADGNTHEARLATSLLRSRMDSSLAGYLEKGHHRWERVEMYGILASGSAYSRRGTQDPGAAIRHSVPSCRHRVLVCAPIRCP